MRENQNLNLYYYNHYTLKAIYSTEHTLYRQFDPATLLSYESMDKKKSIKISSQARKKLHICKAFKFLAFLCITFPLPLKSSNSPTAHMVLCQEIR